MSAERAGPRRALRPCAVPRCPELVRAGRCAAHRRAEERSSDAARGSAPRRGYGHRWRARRAAFLARHPDCVSCGAPASVPDHVVPRRELVAAGVADPDADQWLQALCASCHGAKTVRRDGGFGREKVPFARPGETVMRTARTR